MDYEVSTDIAAPRDVVWNVMTDVERWPEWTGSMRSLHYLNGDRLTLAGRVRIKQPGMPSLVWEVTELVPQESFSWQNKAGGMTTVASHQITPGPADGVTVRLALRQRGLLAGLMALLTARTTRRYVQMEADGLKRRSEEAVRASSA